MLAHEPMGDARFDLNSGMIVQTLRAAHSDGHPIALADCIVDFEKSWNELGKSHGECSGARSTFETLARKYGK